MSIHPRTDIDPTAVLADDVSIGPGVVIGANTVLKAGVELGPNVVLGPNTTLGAGVKVYPGAVIGTEPQDMKYDGSLTVCVVGPNTIIREYCTINRGSVGSHATIVGSNCMLMSCSHVAHDCRVGDHVVMASAALMGGHCQIEDRAMIGGASAFHQFVRVGTLAMVGGMSGLRQDAPPYMIISGGAPATVFGVNVIGLKRVGMPLANRELIKQAHRLLYRSDLSFLVALERIEKELERTPEIEHILEFFRASKRGVSRGHKDGGDVDDDGDENRPRQAVHLA